MLLSVSAFAEQSGDLFDPDTDPLRPALVVFSMGTIFKGGIDGLCGPAFTAKEVLGDQPPWDFLPDRLPVRFLPAQVLPDHQNRG